MDLDIDIKQFLRKENPAQVRIMALEYIFALTNKCEGMEYIKQNVDTLLPAITSNMFESSTKSKALDCIINISIDYSFACILTQSSPFIKCIFEDLIDKDNKFSKGIIDLLSNLTHHEDGAIRIAEYLKSDHQTLNKIIEMVCSLEYSQHCNCDYLASILCNLTQSKEGRKLFIKERTDLFEKILPLTTYKESVLRRSYIIGLIKNCCFETEEVDSFLTVDFLEYILTPLAGPEDFDEEEMDCLPINLQYPDENKSRDPEPSIRKMLLEALYQLCAKRKSRDFLRSNGTYYILREYYKTEKDEDIKKACEDVIDLLLRDEIEMDVDNLKQVIIEKEELNSIAQNDIQYVYQK